MPAEVCKALVPRPGTPVSSCADPQAEPHTLACRSACAGPGAPQVSRDLGKTVCTGVGGHIQAQTYIHDMCVCTDTSMYTARHSHTSTPTDTHGHVGVLEMN